MSITTEHSDLAGRLETIEHRKLDLTMGHDDGRDEDCHRSDISIWADAPEGEPARLSVSIGALWGQPMRFLSLSSIEARELAAKLIEVADEFDRIIG